MTPVLYKQSNGRRDMPTHDIMNINNDLHSMPRTSVTDFMIVQAG